MRWRAASRPKGFKVKFGLFDSAGTLVAAFENEGDAEQFQNRKRPDTVKRRYVPNVFGEPDDIELALYSSWEDFEKALRMVIKRQCEINSKQALECRGCQLSITT